MRKNVLHLIPSFRQGGSESQAVQLAGRLREEGTHRISIACLDREGVLLERAAAFGFNEFEEYPLSSFYDRNMARQLGRFVRSLRSEKIDLVQSHDFYTNIFGMIGARLAGVPVRIAAKRETGMRTKRQLFMERRAFELSTRVAANSQVVREYLIGSGVSGSKVEVIHNGIDLRPFRLEKRDSHCPKRFGIPDGCSRRLVTMVANLRSTVKNHEMFLKAAAVAGARFDDVGFVLAGEGDLVGRYRRVADDLGIGERVFFIGSCADVPALLACSTICALTSDSEGFSNSILEYMAAGRAVVATNAGGAPEAIVDGETGFIVPVGDEKALSDRLCELLADEVLTGVMGQKGRSRVEKRFSAEAQVANTLRLYDLEFERAGRS